MSSSLWQSEGPEPWQIVRQQYDNIVDQYSNDKLKELNRWYEVDLPQAINSRAPNKHITQPELVKLVDWKLTHGKWRPRLLDYAKAAPEQQVQDASTKAFALLSSSSNSSDDPQEPASKKARTSTATPPTPAAAKADPKVAAAQAAAVPDQSVVKATLEHLTVLKGVGPATASVLLAAVDDSCPFMGDEALEAALGKRDYTVKMYLQLLTALRQKADWLNQQADTGDTPWSAVIVERCLHAAELQAKASSPAAAASGGKPKSKSGNKRKSTQR